MTVLCFQAKALWKRRREKNQTSFVNFFLISPKKMFISLTCFRAKSLFLSNVSDLRDVHNEETYLWKLKLFFLNSFDSQLKYRQYYLSRIILLLIYIRICSSGTNIDWKWCDLCNRLCSLPWRYNNNRAIYLLTTTIMWFHAEHLPPSRKIRKKVN